MNTSFSLQRVALLFRKFYTERRNITLLGYFIVLAISAINAYSATPAVLDDQIHYFFYSSATALYMAWITGATIATTYYHRNRLTRLGAITLPASVGEKYTFVWLRSLPVATVEFLLILFFVAGCNNLFNPAKISPLELVSEILNSKDYIGMFLFQSFLMLVLTYRRRQTTGWQTAAQVAMGILIYMAFTFLNTASVNDVHFLFMGGTLCSTTGDTTSLEVASSIPDADIWANCFWVFATLFLWAATYFRYKEEEAQ